MSNPRTVRIVPRILITEQVNQTLELTSVLGQNVPQHMMNLLRRGYAGWRFVRTDVYEHAVPNSPHLTVEVDGSQRPVVTVTIRSRQSITRDQEPGARDRLREEIEQHEADCNHIFNELVNASIQEAILRMAETMAKESGIEQELVWKRDEDLSTPNQQCLRLRVCIPA